MKRLRRFAPWLVSWPLLFAFWVLLVETRTVAELTVGAVAAAVATGGVEAVRAGGAVRFRPTAHPLRPLLALPFRALVDSALVFAELGRHLILRKPLRGRLRPIRFEAGSDGDARAAARRALAVWTASFAPNSFALGVDRERDVILVHELRTRRKHPVPPELARPRR